MPQQGKNRREQLKKPSKSLNLRREMRTITASGLSGDVERIIINQQKKNETPIQVRSVSGGFSIKCENGRISSTIRRFSTIWRAIFCPIQQELLPCISCGFSWIWLTLIGFCRILLGFSSLFSTDYYWIRTSFSSRRLIAINQVRPWNRMPIEMFYIVLGGQVCCFGSEIKRGESFFLSTHNFY